MKKILILWIALTIVITNPVYGHKLITHDGTNKSFDTALEIPNHKISWAIYEDLEKDDLNFMPLRPKKVIRFMQA